MKTHNLASASLVSPFFLLALPAQLFLLAFATLAAPSALVAQPAPAQAGAATGTGVGIIIGSPSGLSLKIPQGTGNSYNFVVGYDLHGHGWHGPGHHDHDHDGHLYVGGDYVWYNYNLIRVSRGRLPLYYGPGLFVSVSEHSSAGIRGVVGLEYQFATAPFDVFLEIGPRINVIPDTHGDIFAGFGARFFF